MTVFEILLKLCCSRWTKKLPGVWVWALNPAGQGNLLCKVATLNFYYLKFSNFYVLMTFSLVRKIYAEKIINKSMWSTGISHSYHAEKWKASHRPMEVFVRKTRLKGRGKVMKWGQTNLLRWLIFILLPWKWEQIISITVLGISMFNKQLEFIRKNCHFQTYLWMQVNLVTLQQ